MSDDFVRIARKIYQQIKFFRCQLHFGVAHRNGVSIDVNPKMPLFNNSWTAFLLRRTPKIRPYTSEQFINSERFGDVIVGACVKSLNLCALLPFDREHND